jgi:hypothetical protein
MNMKHKTFNEMHRDGKRENIKRFFGVVNQKMTGKRILKNKGLGHTSRPGRPARVALSFL